MKIRVFVNCVGIRRCVCQLNVNDLFTVRVRVPLRCGVEVRQIEIKIKYNTVSYRTTILAIFVYEYSYILVLVKYVHKKGERPLVVSLL